MLDRLDLFSEDKIVDITKTKEILATLIHGIQKLKGVKIEQEHQKIIRFFRTDNTKQFVTKKDHEMSARIAKTLE